MNTTLILPLIEASLLITSATLLISLIVSLAILYPAAAFAPNMNVLGVISISGCFFTWSYRYITWRILRSCLLYSWSLLTWTSNIELGSTSIPLCSLIYFARRTLFLYLICINSLWHLASSTYTASFLSSDRSVIQPSPILSVTQSARSGLPWRRNLLCVIPLVLLLNFSGIIS